MVNIVYIGTSLDGYISAPDGSLDWLSYVPVPEGEDLGFAEFMGRVDAVVMGRKTFETLLGFGVGWHYEIPLLLGGGDRLFGELDRPLGFELVDTKVLLGQLVRRHYRRKRG